jgi:hypothetical protein
MRKFGSGLPLSCRWLSQLVSLNAVLGYADRPQPPVFHWGQITNLVALLLNGITVSLYFCEGFVLAIVRCQSYMGPGPDHATDRAGERTIPCRPFSANQFRLAS